MILGFINFDIGPSSGFVEVHDAGAANAFNIYGTVAVLHHKVCQCSVDDVRRMITLSSPDCIG